MEELVTAVSEEIEEKPKTDNGGASVTYSILALLTALGVNLRL